MLNFYQERWRDWPSETAATAGNASNVLNPAGLFLKDKSMFYSKVEPLSSQDVALFVSSPALNMNLLGMHLAKILIEVFSTGRNLT